MRIRITIVSNGKSSNFSTATKAIRFISKTRHKTDRIFFNNEPVPFIDLCELHQLELREKRHNKAQGI
jgi:hypothetical protein